jgi:hypothetical protein
MRFTMLLAAFLWVGATADAQSPKQAPKKMEELIGAANRRMSGVFPTKEFQEKIPFSKFLQMLEKEIAKETPFSIHLDREAFGKDADKMLTAEVNLPPVPARMVFNTALRLALAQAYVKGQEIEFTARPNTLVITTRDRSLYTVAYDVRDLLSHTHFLHQSFAEIKKRYDDEKDQRFGFNFDERADPKKPDEWIARQILVDTEWAGWRDRTPASTIQVVNGTKLLVHTAPSVHEAIAITFAHMKSLCDLAVIMNAKLYALDRAEYDAHFAASFVDPKDKSARLAARATDAQRKMLQARKPILEGDADKLRPNERAVFLTQWNVYQFQAGPGDARPTTAFEGFSFSVRPAVSPDRRCLRLELFHDVEQLVKLTKGTMIEMKTGKELPIELPNLRKSASSGTIDIHDGQAILLAVDYRPKDKVWLLLAEPRIYMEEEEENIRKGAIKPMPRADEKSGPPEPLAEVKKGPITLPPVPLPNTEEMKQLLQAVVIQVMADRDLKFFRDRIGTSADKTFALANGESLAWPAKFLPEVPGLKLQDVDPSECRGFKKRLLGIRLDNLARPKKDPAGWEFIVEVTLHNLGGRINGSEGNLDGWGVRCKAKRSGGRWIVECENVSGEIQ